MSNFFIINIFGNSMKNRQMTLGQCSISVIMWPTLTQLGRKIKNIDLQVVIVVMNYMW